MPGAGSLSRHIIIFVVAVLLVASEMDNVHASCRASGVCHLLAGRHACAVAVADASDKQFLNQGKCLMLWGRYIASVGSGWGPWSGSIQMPRSCAWLQA